MRRNFPLTQYRDRGPNSTVNTTPILGIAFESPSESAVRTHPP